MKAMRIRLLALAVGLNCLAGISAVNAATIDWQSVLQDGGVPANGRYDLQVQLHTKRDADQALGDAMLFPGVLVRDGRFEIPLMLSAKQEAQPELWLELAVRTVGTSQFETLAKRELLQSNAQACWSTQGNAGNQPGINFIGTTDNTGMQLRVNSLPIVTYIPSTSSPIIIAGHNENLAVGVGSVVAGGGQTNNANLGTDDYATISGGAGNTAGNGNLNNTDAPGTTISGGSGNTAGATGATVSGGALNSATGIYSVVSGGGFNAVNGDYATVSGGGGNSASENASVGGGFGNEATGLNATVPGGYLNRAQGAYSFAAGRNAGALHTGALVWSDTSDASAFSSTATNQIRLRAANGLQLQSTDIGVSAADLGNADAVELMVEGVDTQGYFLSDNAGTFGSVLALSEMNNNVFVNTWAIARETTGGGNDLRFSFGTAEVAATNPVKVEFRDDGTVFKASGSASWDVISDARFKHVIAPIENALDRLLQLRGVRFEYTQPSLPGGVELPKGEQLGFVAQEVQAVFPEWVGETEEGYLYIGERGTTALLVEALRELEARNARLEQRLQRLERALGKN